MVGILPNFFQAIPACMLVAFGLTNDEDSIGKSCPMPGPGQSTNGFIECVQRSNYDIYLTADCLAYSKIKPAVNQIETHPYFQRESLVKFCEKHGVSVTAHTPLGGAAANVELFKSKSPLEDPVILELAKKHGKTPAQIVLRWGVQRNTVVIPKSNRTERLQENFDIFDFALTAEDMAKISSLDKKARSNNPEPFWGIDLYA